MYLHDKMITFYANKNLTPVMPYSFDEQNLPCIVYLSTIEKNCTEEDAAGLDEKIIYPFEYYNFYDIDYNWFSDSELQYSDDAISYFKNQGGSYDEIKNRKYHFSDLRNKD